MEFPGETEKLRTALAAMTAERDKAVETLERAGWTLNPGAEAWKPPVNKEMGEMWRRLLATEQERDTAIAQSEAYASGLIDAGKALGIYGMSIQIPRFMHDEIVSLRAQLNAALAERDEAKREKERYEKWWKEAIKGVDELHAMSIGQGKHNHTALADQLSCIAHNWNDIERGISSLRSDLKQLKQNWHSANGRAIKLEAERDAPMSEPMRGHYEALKVRLRLSERELATLTQERDSLREKLGELTEASALACGDLSEHAAHDLDHGNRFHKPWYKAVENVRKLVATIRADGDGNSKPVAKPWRSVAVWPSVVGIGESYDLHYTREEAEFVCRLLEKNGFGGDGKYFPISTRVEPATHQPGKEQG